MNGADDVFIGGFHVFLRDFVGVKNHGVKAFSPFGIIAAVKLAVFFVERNIPQMTGKAGDRSDDIAF